MLKTTQQILLLCLIHFLDIFGLQIAILFLYEINLLFREA